MAQKKDGLKDIRTNLLTRGFSLARAGLKVGGLAAGGLFGRDGKDNPAWLGKVEFLIKELGALKGSAMKVGQTLSMYGEHLLPKEVNDLLKTLQQNSPALEWATIENVLIAEWGLDKRSELEIEEVPVAAASIGQVHRGRIKSTGELVAIKVQYPGVDRAVETDLKLLKFILNISDLVPRGPRFDQIFDEIRVMFHQEINYHQELANLEYFAEILKEDTCYRVPRAFTRHCTGKVLVTEFSHGLRADAPEVQALPEERRNAVGLAFLDLYLRELFEFRRMQTDPHLGNYLIEIDPEGKNDRLVLFDFGAVREVPVDFLRAYAGLVEGGLNREGALIENSGRSLGLLLPEDGQDLVTDYVELCFMLTEPFAKPEWGTAPAELLDANGAYDWGASDLPKRVANRVSKIAVSYKLRAPPRELVFLDRKLGGVFVYLSVLKCRMSGRDRVAARLQTYRAGL